MEILQTIADCIKSDPASRLLVTVDDAAALTVIAAVLTPHSVEPSEHAIKAAIGCLADFRRRERTETARLVSEDLPVRKAISSDIGGSRFYWRVVLLNGHILSVVKEGNRGDLAIAKRKARELYIQGLIPVELIPPDFDPQEAPQRTVNHSGHQPDGLTVRQRTKKV